ncbi:MAG TPA: hypothetical protein VIF62_26080 [Labilithrix sp.]
MRGRDLPLVPPWARGVALSALALVLTVWAWFPMFVAYPGTAIEDGHMFHFYIASSKAAIQRYHELPLWNPFDCKGIPLWDYPENITASPIMWLTAGLTATQTMIAWNVFHVAAGFVGMWLLARGELKLGRSAALVASCFWAFSVGHTTQYAGEHEALISFLDAPILLFLWRRAERNWSYVVGTALAFGWMVYDGATYGLPHIALLLGIETLTRVWPWRRGANVLGRAAVVGVLAFLVGASRLLPILDQFSEHKRPALYPDVDSLAHLNSLRDMYMLRSAGWRSHFPPQQYVFGEYLCYVGWLGFVICLLGLAASAAEASWLTFTGGVLVLLMLGHFSHYAPWSILHEHVFPFKQMRVPSRFRLLLMVPMALWIAFATERVPRWVRSMSVRWEHAVRVAVLGAALLAAGDMVGLGQELIRVRFTDAPEQPVVASSHFYYGGPGLSNDFINFPKQNRAWTGCRSYEWSFKTDAPVWEGDVPQARSTDDDAAHVMAVTRTTSTFTVEVDASRPARILLNSAYDKGWGSDVGSVVEQTHMVAVDVPAGHNVLHVRYWPKKLTLGLILTAIGLLISFIALFRDAIDDAWRRFRT